MAGGLNIATLVDRIRTWCPYVNRRLGQDAIEASNLEPGTELFVSYQGGIREKPHWIATPMMLSLVAVLLFFAARRHEFYLEAPGRLGLVSDLLMVGGSTVGMASTVLYLLRSRAWMKVAAASLALFSIALATNAALFRGTIGSALNDHWYAGFVRLSEEVAFASWIAFSISLLARKRGRAMRASLVLVSAFGVLTLSAVIIGMAGLASTWSYERPTQTQIIESSVWSFPVARAAWYYILLLLIPVAVCGMRVMAEGSGERIGFWFTSLVFAIPTVALVGMLVQLLATGYGWPPGRQFWPVWILSLPCLLMLVLDWSAQRGRAGGHGLLVAASVSVSLVAVGMWCWIRGPGLLYGWSPPTFGTAWRLILRRLVPSSLIGAGLIGAFASIGLPKIKASMVSMGRQRLGRAAIALCPPLISGILVLAVAGDYVLRIGMTLEGMSAPSFPLVCAVLMGSGIAFAGCLLSWRRIVLIVESGPTLGETGEDDKAGNARVDSCEGLSTSSLARLLIERQQRR